MKLVICGAQGVALGAYKAIKTLFSDREMECFLVTEMGNNSPMLGEIRKVYMENIIDQISWLMS